MEQQLHDTVATSTDETRTPQITAAPTNKIASPQDPPLPASRSPDPSMWRKFIGQPGVRLPLFYRIIKRPNGEIVEVMWGPTAVQLLRWVVVLILGSLTIWKGGSVPGLAEAFKWLSSLR